MSELQECLLFLKPKISTRVMNCIYLSQNEFYAQAKVVANFEKMPKTLHHRFRNKDVRTFHLVPLLGYVICSFFIID